MYRILLIAFITIVCSPFFSLAEKLTSFSGDDLINVLIFSGKNNHEWQKTTPLLVRILKNSKLFSVCVTDKPDTISYNTLKNFNLVISNWNTWPDNNLRLTADWQDNFVRYVNEGGGALFFHAGASSFYNWDDYFKIGIGRWGPKTNHGAATIGKVYNFDQNHPITSGIDAFYITDEIWENCEISPGSIPLANLSATNKRDVYFIDVPSVFVAQTGKGRSFYTILGHDERALLNSGLKTLLLRAAQWCAGRDVTVEIPREMRTDKIQIKDSMNWMKSDSSISLKNNSEVIWQFNFKNRLGRPYFHPLTIKHSDLTCVSPPDHPWHLGLWFSWKFINGVNYWEYLPEFKSEETGFQSEGITQILRKKITANSDFSADILLKIGYHPKDGKTILTEERSIHVSKLMADGSYYINEEHTFRAVKDGVLLDRTPVAGEPDGKSWGGYAGLSIRFNQDYSSPELISSIDTAHYKKGSWLFMGFNTLAGSKAGLAIFEHPQYTTPSSSWYLINDQKIPFYYFSPAILFDHKIVLKKGEELHLKYRIWMLPGDVTKDMLSRKFNEYL